MSKQLISRPPPPIHMPIRSPPPPPPPPQRSMVTKTNTAPVVDLSLTDPDWLWIVSDRVRDKLGRVHLKKHVKDEVLEPNANGPFELIYDRTIPDFWPDLITIVLSSGPLIRILQKYLPNNGDLKSLERPNITGRELFIVFDSLKMHMSSFDEDCQPTTATQTAPEETKSLSLNKGESQLHASLDEPTLSVKDGESKKLASSQSPRGKVPKDKMSLSTKDRVKGEGCCSCCRCTKAPVLTDEEIGRRHLRHLIRFLEEEYKDILVKVERMREEKRVPWDMLWAFLPCGTKVVYYCDLSEEMLCAVVSANYYRKGEVDAFVLHLDVWNYNGQRYRKCQIQRRISSYVGERAFSGLPVCPVEIIGNSKQLEEGFLANGKMFYELAVRSTHRFMQYSGPIFQEKAPCSILKEKADGRVMIDLASFAKMNPQYPMGNAKPPTLSKVIPYKDLPRGGGGGGGLLSIMEASESTIRNSTVDHANVTDESLIFAPAIVYGFSFALKQWGTFAVGGFREIVFDTKAFDELTMEPDMKELVHDLVSQYVVASDGGSLKLKRVDPIAQKGEGCVFLCYGPPGSGKTLTAESIAEALERPLWALSVAELGTTPEALERTLMKVLDIATIWQAVLLLDEADVYLEKRTSKSNLVRNAMTGVFLRMLEYYQGVLFLTTNRIGTFDEAFRSRISVFLRYPPLSVDDRQKVWRTLMRRGAVEGITDQLCHELATRDLNGREIRTAIHTAQVWAKSKGEPLEPRHVKHVIGLLANSLEALNKDLQNSSAE